MPPADHDPGNPVRRLGRHDAGLAAILAVKHGAGLLGQAGAVPIIDPAAKGHDDLAVLVLARYPERVFGVQLDPLGIEHVENRIPVAARRLVPVQRKAARRNRAAPADAAPSRGPPCRPRRINRASSRRGPCMIVIASGNRRLFSGMVSDWRDRRFSRGMVGKALARAALAVPAATLSIRLLYVYTHLVNY